MKRNPDRTALVRNTEETSEYDQKQGRGGGPGSKGQGEPLDNTQAVLQTLMPSATQHDSMSCGKTKSQPWWT